MSEKPAIASLEKSTFACGDRVEQMCLKCGEERGHVVASVSKKGKITRVSCPVCGSRAPYKSGGVSTRAASGAGAPYDASRTYRRGQVMIHPVFGEGEVTALIEPCKIDVLFADRMRRLIHSHAE